MFTKNYYTVQPTQNGLATNKASGCWYHNLVNTNGTQIPTRGSSYEGTTYKLNGMNVFYPNIATLLLNFPKVAKSEWPNDTNYRTATTSNVYHGVVFGNGTDAESIDSYSMPGDLFTTYTVSYSSTFTYDETGFSRTVLYTLTNTGEEDFTISEVGLIGYCYEDYTQVSSTYNHRYWYNTLLFERTLLENPITIPGNGGVGQVSYTIRLDYPTT